jgi:hypothetical protein
MIRCFGGLRALGILFACAEDWEDVDRVLTARYTVCEEWLRRSGLAIEPDKMELLFFQKPYEHNAILAPTRLILPDPSTQSYYVVLPVENLRYLGFFINRRLKWEHHVRIMCNQAQASIKALQVLGNSIRGLSMANWRLVLNAVCLPVLAYGSQLWYLTGAAKGLLNMVQRVQNDMVRQVTGAFRTAPRCYGRLAIVSDVDDGGVCPECRQGVERICRAITKQVQRSDARIEVDVMHTWNECTE